MSILIEYGPVTQVLGTGWKADRFPLDQMFTPDDLKRWWTRADYGWRCDACPYNAVVLLKTLAGAKRSAEKHAGEHPRATVKPVRQETRT
jgi:hypothetical protein